jgi:hypothetical protein
MTRASSVGVACLVGALAAISCDGEDSPTVLPIDDAPDAFVEAWCDRLESCNCDSDSVPSQEECRADVELQIARIRDDGEDNSLIYDGTCLGAQIDRLDDRGCDPYRPEADDECEPPCWPYHGTRVIGEGCKELGYFTNCAQGLVCEIETCDSGTCTGTCQTPCRRAGVGDSCDDVQCVDTALCIYEETGPVCRRIPDVGDPCLQGECAEGSFCVVDPVDPTIQTCTAAAPLGEACMGHPQCESGYCPAGFCEELPGKGDPCFGRCAGDLECDFETNECVTAEPAICNDHPL